VLSCATTVTPSCPMACTVTTCVRARASDVGVLELRKYPYVAPPAGIYGVLIVRRKFAILIGHV
jgi:hypothetical protein